MPNMMVVILCSIHTNSLLYKYKIWWILNHYYLCYTFCSNWIQFIL